MQLACVILAFWRHLYSVVASSLSTFLLGNDLLGACSLIKSRSFAWNHVGKFSTNFSFLAETSCENRSKVSFNCIRNTTLGLYDRLIYFLMSFISYYHLTFWCLLLRNYISVLRRTIHHECYCLLSPIPDKK